MSAFNLKIKELRAVLKLSQKEFADKIGVIQQEIGYQESSAIERLHIKRDSAISEWRDKYPLDAAAERHRSYMHGIGTVQIVSGIIGFIATIVDVNAEQKVSGQYDIPVFNSSNVQTGTKTITQKYSFKHDWNSINTVTALLSSGLIVSGIVSVNF